MNIADMKDIKERHGYTNEMISKKSGVPLSTVQKIFAGATKHPRFETMNALEKALCGSGLPADEMIAEMYRMKAEEANRKAEKEAMAADNAAAAPNIETGEEPDSVTASKKPYRYDISGECAPQAMVCEAAAAYGAKEWASDEEDTSNREGAEKKEAARDKKPGEYTLEDYYALPDHVRAELIDGNLILMESPSSIHQILVNRICYSLTSYIDTHKGKCMAIPSPMDVQLDCDEKTMLEPDVLVVCDRSKIIHRCVYGAPDFIVEILSPSTKRKDMTLKLTKYWNAGVREYWVVDPDRKKIITYCQPREENRGFDYDVALYGFDDVVPVGIFSGRCMIDFKEIYEYISFLY